MGVHLCQSGYHIGTIPIDNSLEFTRRQYLGYFEDLFGSNDYILVLQYGSVKDIHDMDILYKGSLGDILFLCLPAGR